MVRRSRPDDISVYLDLRGESDYRAALRSANRATGDFATQAEAALGRVSGLFGRVGVGAGQLTSGVRTAGAALAAIATPAAAAATALGAVAAVTVGASVALAAVGTSASENITEVARLARVLGVSSEEFSKYAFAAREVGASTDDVFDAIQDLTQRAANIPRDFERWGIATRDVNGQLLSQSEILRNTADRVRTAANETERLALADELGGDALVRLLPLLRQGAAGLDEYGRAAEQAGAIVSSDLTAVNAQYVASTRRLEAGLTAVSNELAEAFLPIVTQGAEELGVFLSQVARGADEWLPPFVDLLKITADLLISVGRAGLSAGSILADIGSTLTVFSPALSGALDTISDVSLEASGALATLQRRLQEQPNPVPGLQAEATARGSVTSVLQEQSKATRTLTRAQRELINTAPARAAEAASDAQALLRSLGVSSDQVDILESALAGQEQTIADSSSRIARLLQERRQIEGALTLFNESAVAQILADDGADARLNQRASAIDSEIRGLRATIATTRQGIVGTASAIESEFARISPTIQTLREELASLGRVGANPVELAALDTNEIRETITRAFADIGSKPTIEAQIGIDRVEAENFSRAFGEVQQQAFDAIKASTADATTQLEAFSAVEANLLGQAEDLKLSREALAAVEQTLGEARVASAQSALSEVQNAELEAFTQSDAFLRASFSERNELLEGFATRYLEVLEEMGVAESTRAQLAISLEKQITAERDRNIKLQRSADRQRNAQLISGAQSVASSLITIGRAVTNEGEKDAQKRFETEKKFAIAAAAVNTALAIVKALATSTNFYEGVANAAIAGAAGAAQIATIASQSFGGGPVGANTPSPSGPGFNDFPGNGPGNGPGNLDSPSTTVLVIGDAGMDELADQLADRVNRGGRILFAGNSAQAEEIRNG